MNDYFLFQDQLLQFSDVLLSKNESNPTGVSYISTCGDHYVLQPLIRTQRRQHEKASPSPQTRKIFQTNFKRNNLIATDRTGTQNNGIVHFITKQENDDIRTNIDKSNKVIDTRKKRLFKDGRNNKQNITFVCEPKQDNERVAIIIDDGNLFRRNGEDITQYVEIRNPREQQIQNIIYNNDGLEANDVENFNNNEEENN